MEILLPQKDAESAVVRPERSKVINADQDGEGECAGPKRGSLHTYSTPNPNPNHPDVQMGPTLMVSRATSMTAHCRGDRLLASPAM